MNIPDRKTLVGGGGLEPVLDEPEGLALWEQHQDPVERTHQLLLTVQQLTQQKTTAVTADTAEK
jgi:hypothetical protein